MSSFGYHGLDSSGRTISGVISASSDVEAKRMLAEQGIFPGSVWSRTGKRFRLGRGKRLSLRQQAAFIRSLATMLEARLPILSALRVIGSEKGRGAVRSVCGELEKRVEAGMSLASALEEAPEDFPPMMVSLVAAGERSGSLDQTLRAFAGYLETQDRLRGKLRGMMAYPLTVFCLALGLVAVLLVFVLPALETIFESARGTLPLPSRILLGAKTLLIEDPWIPVLLIALAGAAGWMISGAPLVRRWWARVLLTVPPFGKTLTALETGRFSFALSTLLKGGVPLEEALSLTQRTLKNPLFVDAVQKARAGILEGGSLLEPLREAGVFPPTAVQMIGVGEQTGNLPRMLDHLARLFREEGERQFEVLVRMAEPALILVVGMFIAFVALAVLLPIFEAGQLVRG
ncbi:MAG: type II secretion system F family protein [Nitrospinota bacterium]